MAPPLHFLPQVGNKDASAPPHPAWPHCWWPGTSMSPLLLASVPQGSPARGDSPKALGTHGIQGYAGKAPLGTLSTGQDPSRVRAARRAGCSPALPCLSFPTLGSCDPGSASSCLHPAPTGLPGPEHPPFWEQLSQTPPLPQTGWVLRHEDRWPPLSSWGALCPTTVSNPAPHNNFHILETGGSISWEQPGSAFPVPAQTALPGD